MRAGFRFVVDPWDPGYAASIDPGIDAANGGRLAPSPAELDLDLEVAARRWAPVSPRSAPAPRVDFVDGIRRVDARVWLLDGAGPQPGLAASYAAGVVSCDGSAAFGPVFVGRGVFSASPLASDVLTAKCGSYRAHHCPDPAPETLTAAVQAQMRDLEIAAATAAVTGWGQAAGERLLVLDGPLRGREHLPDTLGYIKTHQAAYLPEPQLRVVGELAPGQRTPVFTVGTHWIRHTWYLRLPGPNSHPWAGVVRAECSARLTPSAAVALADLSAATLPRYASEPHKEGRAPQNLYPIAGLERQLRHRLGERDLAYRQLCLAAG